jgi:hypothetical protein
MVKSPKLIGEGETITGQHNEDIEKSIERVDKSKMYKDLTTVIVCPTRGTFPTRVVQSWMKLMKPMNQQVYGPIFAESMQVDTAYNTLFQYVLDSPLLNKAKYILTIEEDNLPPPDGLLKLYESMDKYDVVGGLYWGKGENGFPMMFGDPENGPEDGKPVLPQKDTVQQVNALGMGFNLFKTDIFKNIDGPWFKTIQEYHTDYGTGEVISGMGSMTQDVYFYRLAAEHGYKFACDTSVHVGHFDAKNDKVW